MQEDPLWAELDRAPRRSAVIDRRSQDRAEAVLWAQGLVAENNFVALDTETTGLDSGAEIIQLGIVAPDGGTLLNCLIKSQSPVPEDAYRVHGIGDNNLILAASFPEVYPTLCAVVRNRRVIIYNREYDSALLMTARQRYGLPPFGALSWECAMLKYAAYVGDWNERRLSYRWQRLPQAPGVKAHDAVSDCLSTIELVKRMAGGR